MVVNGYMNELMQLHFVLIDDQPWRQPKCENWDKHKPCNLWDQTESKVVDKKNIVINAREDLYAEIKNEYFLTPHRPDGAYGAVMNILFEPSFGVRRQFLDTMKELNLKPRQYLAAHFRDRVSGLFFIQSCLIEDLFF